MKPEEIKLADWSRIALGQVPPSFYLELFIRAILVYILLSVSLRLLGKRMATHISMLDLTAMISLASAIGVPMLSYDRGILPAFIIAFVIVGVTRIIAKLNYNNQHFERVVQGDIDMLVEDSKMDLEAMQKVRITRERLFAHLRSENINQLGRVKRMYLEANGAFTIVENEEERAGLMVLPEWDKEFIQEKLRLTSTVVCYNCGYERPAEKAASNGSTVCDNCGNIEWTKGVIEKVEMA